MLASYLHINFYQIVKSIYYAENLMTCRHGPSPVLERNCLIFIQLFASFLPYRKFVFDREAYHRQVRDPAGGNRGSVPVPGAKAASISGDKA